jgi:hypothetical protein
MRSHYGSNGTPLDPPLFWLDNIFKGLAMHLALAEMLCYKHLSIDIES